MPDETGVVSEFAVHRCLPAGGKSIQVGISS
jgi:hypothetical protein